MKKKPSILPNENTSWRRPADLEARTQEDGHTSKTNGNVKHVGNNENTIWYSTP